MFALHHGGDTLKPHAGINRRPRQINPLTGGQLFILHEDQIPDLDKPVTVFIGGTGRAARDRFTVIEENLRTRAAGGRYHPSTRNYQMRRCG